MQPTVADPCLCGGNYVYLHTFEQGSSSPKKQARKHDKAMVWASFAADALALGVHWIYSIKRIARDFGLIETLLDPGPQSYHAAKHRGDFTHYGDQAFVLLESLAARGAFDPQDFSLRWRELFNGYHDQATKATLGNWPPAYHFWRRARPPMTWRVQRGSPLWRIGSGMMMTGRRKPPGPRWP